MITISLRIPEDVVDELKGIAPRRCSPDTSRFRTYLRQGLRRNLEVL